MHFIKDLSESWCWRSCFRENSLSSKKIKKFASTAVSRDPTSGNCRNCSFPPNRMRNSGKWETEKLGNLRAQHFFWISKLLDTTKLCKKNKQRKNIKKSVHSSSFESRPLFQKVQKLQQFPVQTSREAQKIYNCYFACIAWENCVICKRKHPHPQRQHTVFFKKLEK